MKRRHFLLLILSLVLLTVGLPVGYWACEHRRVQAGRDLITAIKASNIPAALSALQAGANPNSRDHADDRQLSVREQFHNFVAAVLHRNPPAKPDACPTALLLHLRVDETDSTNLVQALLEAGADPNLADGGGDTPLHAVCGGPESPNFALLVKYHANVNARAEDGETPSDFAHMFGWEGYIPLLQKLGGKTGAALDAEAQKGRQK